MRHSRYSGIRLLCLALSVIFLTALLMACSANPVMTNSQMRDFVYNNFGITVRTRIVTLSNGAVAYEWISGELSSQHKKLINDSAKSKFQVTVLRNPTVKYNCHSYAWYSNSSSNRYWIDNPAKFRKNWITSVKASNTIPASVKNGDSVDYYISSNGNRPHSAVVYNKASGLFVSKRGLGGLYVHKPTKTPYNGGDVITKEFGYYRP